ncbi:DUF2917 domain-containing protein [Variovorax sp. J22R133]|uniref:DUF2917 domain-containing protein n=1 Tax=Variovorax brevis TaxID=3053503 RepID=UPI002575DE1F|nr:DUF2917 domain-containing protein [Variovorax sp. J22R133]MDM0116571.1 DUF2917 domain-containing protein [Variovorax sp. J22R133]
MSVTALLPRFSQSGFPTWNARKHQTATGPVLRNLPNRSILALENRELRLVVVHGCVWITRDGCPADWVLDVGDVFNQQPGAPVLVQALEDTEILIADASTRNQNA